MIELANQAVAAGDSNWQQAAGLRTATLGAELRVVERANLISREAASHARRAPPEGTKRRSQAGHNRLMPPKYRPFDFQTDRQLSISGKIVLHLLFRERIIGKDTIKNKNPTNQGCSDRKAIWGIVVIFRIAIATILALVSFTSSASVIKEIDGVFYEWLELTETQGLSRESVETLLADQDSALYGYQYASKELVEKLFLSYASWDGLNGYHGDASVINGSLAFLNDFGVTGSAWSLGYESAFHTVDGYTIYYDGSYIFNRGLYGTGTECSRNQTDSCLAEQFVQFNLEGDGVMAWQHQNSGWDSDNYFTTKYAKIYPNPSHGSYLVKASVIPIPAAAWLFCSALIALIMAPGCRSNPLTPTNVVRR